MSRKISIQTLADQLGLSKYAVSRALGGKSGVSEETRARVLELARTLGYRQHTPGVASTPFAVTDTGDLRPPQPLFALICMNQTNLSEPHYWQRVLSGMISACDERGWHHVIVSPSLTADDDNLSPEQAIAPHLDWTYCAGIIVMGAFPHTVMKRLSGTGRSMILVDHHDPLLNCDTVSHDNLEAGITAAQYLLSIQSRRIGLITDDGRATSFAQRRMGMELMLKRAQTQHGVTATLHEWNVSYEQGDWLEQLARDFRQLPEAERPDAWVGVNDDIALRWMRKLQDMGFIVPEDCRVLGIDNVHAAASAIPPLTTVHLCKEELGQRAIEALQRRMERPGSPRETIMLSTKLIPRDSA